jgi:type IV secretion system protein VirB10
MEASSSEYRAMNAKEKEDALEAERERIRKKALAAQAALKRKAPRADAPSPPPEPDVPGEDPAQTEFEAMTAPEEAGDPVSGAFTDAFTENETDETPGPYAVPEEPPRSRDAFPDPFSAGDEFPEPAAAGDEFPDPPFEDGDFSDLEKEFQEASPLPEITEIEVSPDGTDAPAAAETPPENYADAFGGPAEESQAGEADASFAEFNGDDFGAPPNDDNAGQYVPSPKKSAANAMSGGPDKLNKSLLIGVVVGGFALLYIFVSFILPLINMKKAEAIARKTPSQPQAVDYSLFAEHRPQPPAEFAETEPEEEIPGLSDDEILSTLPPITPAVPARRPAPAAAPVPRAANSSNSASSAPPAASLPDTRNDKLQAKSIPGIKGLTPSQRVYADGSDGSSASTAAAPPAQTQTQSQSGNPYARFGAPATKEEYAAQMLAQNNGQPQAASVNSYTAQNDQSGKNAFYNANRGNADGGAFLGPYTLFMGTIIEAALTSAISTDLPGDCTAVVTKNVYASLNGRSILIPQNSRLFGNYNSSISYNQSRVQVGWHTLIRPDGFQISLGNMSATDSKGASGLKGFINDHPFAYLKALGLITAFRIVSRELSGTSENTDNPYVQDLMADSLSVTNTLGAKLIDRAMDVQPTITIREGTKINVVVNMNLTMPPLEPFPVTREYRK